MENVNWTTNNIPSQQGKTFLITGANSGLGFEATKVLSKKGAHIIMTARNLQKGNEALEATDENVKGSEYFGPTKMMELKGYPKLVKSSDKSYDKDLAKKLWKVSEKLTNLTYEF